MDIGQNIGCSRPYPHRSPENRAVNIANLSREDGVARAWGLGQAQDLGWTYIVIYAEYRPHVATPFRLSSRESA